MATNSPDKAAEPPSSAADTQTHLPPPPSSSAVTQTSLPSSPPTSPTIVTQSPPPPSFTVVTQTPLPPSVPPSSAVVTQTPLPPSVPPSSAVVTQTPLPPSVPPSSAVVTQTPLPPPSAAITQKPLSPPPPPSSAVVTQTPLPPPPSSATVTQTPLPPPPFSAAETQTAPPPPPPSTAETQTTPPPPQLPPALPSKIQPPAKPEVPLSEPKAPSEASIILVPSHSRWFSWDSIHECEVRHLPDSSKNPRVYKYYRNSIVKYFRFNPNRKITFTDVRKTLVGDVGSIRRVFDFLETWGLINYHPSSSLSKPFKWEDKDSKPEAESPSPTPIKETVKRICSGCKALCTIACFACDKYDLTMCARCYVRGNYRVGVGSSDFRRVEISEETKTEWSEKETLSLLEAITHYSDDWKRVSQHVVGRTEKECVARFLKLPFGDQFLHYQHSALTDDTDDAECESETVASAESSKRMRLTPLADTSNPIMAQAAFLSALAGPEVAQAAAQAALTTLSDVYKANRFNYRPLPKNTLQQDAGVTSNGVNAADSIQGSLLRANIQLEKEESDVEKAISEIIDVQMKNIQDKLTNFEDLDLLMEKECQQLDQVKNLFFLDQLNLLFHKPSAPKPGENLEGSIVKTN